MKRTCWTLLALLGALAVGRPGEAAEVAVVRSQGTAGWEPALTALRRRAGAAHRLTDYDLRGDRAYGAQMLAAMRDRSPIVVAFGPLAASLAREVLPAAPLVYCMILDPEEAGIVPAPHVTGVAFRIPPKNQLAAYRMVYPRGTRLGVVYNAANVKDLVEQAEQAAPLLRLIVTAKAVTAEREVPAALRALLQGPDEVDMLWLPSDPMLLSDATRRFILGETLKAGKPVFAFSTALVQEGAMASNGPDYASIGELAAELVGRLAGGERRIDPLVPRAELVVNTKVASKLRIEIPADALRVARKF